MDLKAVAKLWNQGSVIRSWLMELAQRALESDPKLETVEAHVNDSGMGRWTVLEARTVTCVWTRMSKPEEIRFPFR